MITSKQNIEIIDCQTAKDFISVLRVSDNYWLPHSEREAAWIFRGQSDANWELLASGWRNSSSGKSDEWENKRQTFIKQLNNPIEKAILSDAPGYICRPENAKAFNVAVIENPALEKVLHYAIFEIEAIRFFAEYVDKLGFRVPQLSIARLDAGSGLDWKFSISHGVDFLKKSDWKGEPFRLIWPHKEEPIVALARHHGMPVSLIDWTRKPLIAAFFAADGATSIGYSSENLAVWAIHKDLIGGAKQRLQQPTLPRSDLGFLHAQDAVLTYDVGADWFFINQGRWPTILDAVEATSHGLSFAPLRKITLPTSETKELLRLLWAEGISGAHLMPTFDNITSTLRKYWPEF